MWEWIFAGKRDASKSSSILTRKQYKEESREWERQDPEEDGKDIKISVFDYQLLLVGVRRLGSFKEECLPRCRTANGRSNETHGSQ